LKTKHGWWTYRLYCPDGCLVYVGMTNNLYKRLRQHHVTNGRVFGSFKAKIHRTQRGAQIDELILMAATRPHWNRENFPVHRGVFMAGPVHKDAEPCPHGWAP
jgi:GIY-YIG catalytic domain-containing protein